MCCLIVKIIGTVSYTITIFVVVVMFWVAMMIMIFASAMVDMTTGTVGAARVCIND